jgi:hypothetical protein
MRAYCKQCNREHAAWNRLNDGVICGLCGARERDPEVKPVQSPDHIRHAAPNDPTRTTPLR